MNELTTETDIVVLDPTAEALPLETAKKPSKVMVLAVHRDQAGEAVLTPIDIEHESDDQTDLCALEKLAKELLTKTYTANEGAMKDALGALHKIFDQRLYREQFRTFENFCFAMYGTHRINDVLMKKIRKKGKELQADLEEQP
jgi:hypothetical protein